MNALVDHKLTYYQGDIPHFFKRSAITQELYNTLIEFRPSETSSGIEEHLKGEFNKQFEHHELTKGHRTPSP